MNEDTKTLLFDVAGFLSLITRGIVSVPDHIRNEASELLAKIGKADLT